MATLAVKNAKAAIWTNETLNGVLAQLRKLRGKSGNRMKVVRNSSAGTVVAYILKENTRQEYLRAMRLPTKTWMVRFDSKMFQPRS